MKFYCIPAHATASEIEVIDRDNPVGGYALNPRWDLGNVYGPGQVALAILADALGDDKRALATYMEFRFRVLSRYEGKEIEISHEDVCQAIRDIKRTHGRST